jgi:hypothetical protein
MSHNKNVHMNIFSNGKELEKRMTVSLESVKDTVDSIVIFDIGLTDNTIQIITTFCKKNNIFLFFLQNVRV